MKKLITFIILAAMFLAMSSFSSLVVSAEEKTLTVLDSATDLRVIFQFDKENPDITFISPSGSKLSKNNSRVKTSSGNGWCTYLIEGAEAGEWKIEYDKKSNNTVSYDIIKSIDNIAIQYFKINKVDGANASVSFNADFPSGGYYIYEIFLIDENSTDDHTVISSGSAQCGADNTVDINMSRISSGSDYKFGFFVSMNDEELFDQVYSDTFSYTNPSSPEALTDFKIHLNKRMETVTVDWSEAENLNSNSFLIEVTNSDGKEVYKNTLNEKQTIFTYDSGNDELNISVSQNVGGIWSTPCSKTLNLNSPYSATILTDDVASSIMGQISCTTNAQSSVYLEMAPDKNTPQEEKIIKEINIDKDEIIDFTLTNTYTYVFVSMLAPDGIYYEDSLDIYLDNDAPFITLYENYERLNVNTGSVTIIGETNSGAVLKVNGKEVKLSANGEFSAKVKLDMGENIIEITSTDNAGNSTKRTVVINRVAGEQLDFSPKGFISLLIGLGISVIITVLALIFFRHRKEG